MTGFAGLLKTEDPRTPMQRARKFELLQFAKANNVSEINEMMPAELMRAILMQKGLTNIRVPNRPLGMVKAAQDNLPSAHGNAVDATAQLMKQYQQGAYSAPAEASEPEIEIPDIPVEQMKINQLRHACIKQGHKLGRKTTKQDMLDLLNGKNASPSGE